MRIVDVHRAKTEFSRLLKRRMADLTRSRYSVHAGVTHNGCFVPGTPVSATCPVASAARGSDTSGLRSGER